MSEITQHNLAQASSYTGGRGANTGSVGKGIVASCSNATTCCRSVDASSSYSANNSAETLRLAQLIHQYRSHTLASPLC